MHSLVDLQNESCKELSNRKERDAGPSSLWVRLIFDGNEKNYELWKTKFFCIPLSARVETTDFKWTHSAWRRGWREKRQGLWAELIPFLDDTILSPVMHDAADDGRAALKILWGYYTGKGKPRVINLYTSLRKPATENVTEYVIRAEDCDDCPAMAWGDQWPSFDSNGFERAAGDIQTVCNTCDSDWW